MSGVLLASFAVTVAMPSAGASSQQSETAVSGSVSATVTYRSTRQRGPSSYRVSLTVERGGKRAYSGPVPPFTPRWVDNQPLRLAFGRTSRTITVINLNGREPEIVLNFWGGGAHCCFWSRVYRWDRRQLTYDSFPHFWGNVGYSPERLSGDKHVELVTADNRFAYVFTSYAGTGFPIKILDYRRRRLVNATRSYPAAIVRDAAQQLKYFRKNLREHFEVRGLLAAWVADEALLGRSRAAFSWLNRHKSVLVGHSDPGSAQSYIRHLRNFLEKTGYLN